MKNEVREFFLMMAAAASAMGITAVLFFVCLHYWIPYMLGLSLPPPFLGTVACAVGTVTLNAMLWMFLGWMVFFDAED